jgi:uncharacterized membrane protein
VRILWVVLAALAGFAAVRLLSDVGFYVVCGIILVGCGVYAGLQNRRELNAKRK